MNNKGFTLIELLATIVIIGVIMTLVMPSASKVSRKNKERLYEEYENMMVEYARAGNFVDVEVIQLDELDGLDNVKNECDGYITVTGSVEPYTYKAYISCDNYTTSGYNASLVH